MESFFDKREKQIETFDSCILSARKNIKIEEIKEAMRLFGEFSDGEDDYDDEEEKTV